MAVSVQALGLAVLETNAANHTKSVAAATQAAALTDGYGLAFTVGAGFTLAGALVAAVMLRARPATPARAIRRRRAPFAVTLPREQLERRR